MKALVLLFLVGCASASLVYDVLDDAAEEIYHDFMVGLEPTSSLGLEDAYYYADDTDDVKNELGKKLRESLDQLLEKIKEAVDHGKTVRDELQDKLKEIREKMKDLRIDIGGKAKEMLQQIREKSKEFIKNLLEKLGLKNNEKRSLQEEEIELALLEFNLRDLFGKLKKALLDKIDKEKLKAKVEELFGKGSEMADTLLELINKKGDEYKQKIHDLIDRYLGKKETRSIKEYWQKIKDYFKDIGVDIQEKYSKFGEWVKEKVGSGLDKGKGKIANIREIAKEFIDHTKGVSKEVAEEALEFLRPYKDDLGSLYDQVKQVVKDIVNKKD